MRFLLHALWAIFRFIIYVAIALWMVAVVLLLI